MAQMIKSALKNKILTAAKAEFLEAGYENASLRHIAARAEMTAGNLYHYFANKEDLYNCLIADALKDLQNLALENDIDLLFSSIHSKQLNLADLPLFFDNISSGLVSIYNKGEDEFRILLNRSEVCQQIKDWFSAFFMTFISRNYSIAAFREEIAIVVDSFATAIYAGMSALFNNSSISGRMMQSLLRIYLRSYVDMLAIEIRKYLKRRDS